jgi:hypothetical protein
MKMILPAGVVALSVALTGGSVLTAHAQDADDFEGGPPEISGSAQAGISYRDETDIDDGGKFDAFGVRLGGRVGMELTDEWMVSFGANYEFNSYDFTSGPEFWEDIHTFRANAIFRYVLDESWRIFGGPLVTLSGDSDADTGDSLTGGGLAGAKKTVHEDLSVGAVVGAFSQIEDDTQFFIFPLVDWKFAEAWSVHVGATALGSRVGPGAEVTYAANETWSFGGGLQMQNRRFRLADDGPVPDGVGEETAVPIYAKATYQASPDCSVDVHIGVTAGGNITVDDEDGDEQFDSDYDPAIQIGARVLCGF